MPKFFIKEDQIRDGKIFLNGDDAFHISRSLRMAKGEHITVSNAWNMEYDCVLSDFSADGVWADILCSKPIESELPIRVSLYQALPKGDKLDSIIQKAVECGVNEIIPFVSERCIAKSKHDTETRKTERRGRIAVEAAKQSGRGVIPKVFETVDFNRAIDRALEADVCLFCYEGETEESLRDALESKAESIRSLSIVIGSEGGFSPVEAAYASEKGCLSVSLGKRILRTETASSFVLACIAYAFEM